MTFHFQSDKKPVVETQVRRHIDFYGRVQGVGFRYTAHSYAKSLHLTGWVQNCLDGHVEMEIQGREEDIQTLLEQLKSERWIHIEELNISPIPVRTGEKGFRITG